MKTETNESETKTNGVGKRRRNHPITLEFPLESKYYRHVPMPFADGRKKDADIFHLYPTLGEYQGGIFPDEVNPRSHDTEAIKSDVAREIERCILERPEEFVRANRGIIIIANEIEYDKQKETVKIIVTDDDIQGVADGGTTDRVIAKVQEDLLEGKKLSEITDAGTIPDCLYTARVHLEIWRGLGDREQIIPLVAGRNTSRQVKEWSLGDFEKRFEGIKTVFKATKFADKIGYEENAPTPMSVLDVLALATTLHKEYDEDNEEGIKTPTVAYSGKGRLYSRLLDPKTEDGYKALEPILPKLVEVRDYIYSTMGEKYDQAFGTSDSKPRFGRRPGVKPLDEPYELPMTGRLSKYRIPNGYIYPILAAFRCLISYRRETGEAYWNASPEAFWDKNGAKLMKVLIQQLEANGDNPNKLGKADTAYSALHDKASLLAKS